jgi:putative endonuclease
MKLSKVAIGRDAEHKAIHFLEGKGYVFIAANYRYKRGEIDLIMKDGEILVFIEVKARKNDEFGYPEQWVSSKKLDLIQQTAEGYMIQCNWHGRIRFDIVSISGKSGCYHLEDVS